MLCLVLLAAGFSRRFHGNKLLAPWQGKPLYRHGLEALSQLCQGHPRRTLIVVTQYEEIFQHAQALGALPLWNHRSQEGLSSSLRLGLSACPPEAHVLFSAADQPGLSPQALEDFLTAFFASRRGMGCFSHQGQPGNPAIFSPAYREELMALRGDAGAKKLLRRHEEDRFLWEGPDPFDVDTPEDLLRHTGQ